MIVHFFTFGDVLAGSSRQRAFRIADELEARGYKTIIHWPPVLLISRTRWPKKPLLILATIRSLFSIKKNDVVFLQRTVSNKYFFVIMVAYLKLFRRKMIFDFDDPIYTHSFLKTKVFTQMADVVIACNHALADWARQYNDDVHVVHIALKFSDYKKFTKDYSASTGKCVIGWVGTAPEHLHNLEMLASVFKKLLAKTSTPFRFVLIGSLGNQKIYDLFESINGLDVEFIDSLDWNNQESVPSHIQTFDIGVLPHGSEGEWNKGKSSFKILEYMACGVASVCSLFGEMPYIIKDGVNGCVAKEEDEWVEKLERLISDRELRAKLGKAGQERVQEEYCFDAIIPRIIEIIETL